MISASPGRLTPLPHAPSQAPDGQTCAKCGCDKTSGWRTSKGVFAAKGAALCKKCSGSEVARETAWPRYSANRELHTDAYLARYPQPPYLGAQCSVETCGKTETLSWRTSKVRAGELICLTCYDREKKLMGKKQTAVVGLIFVIKFHFDLTPIPPTPRVG